MNTDVLLTMLKKDQGKYLASINPWKYPKDEPWKQKFFYDMWTTAFTNNSLYAFHTLTLYTPDEFIEKAIELAIEDHSREALTPLLGKKYRYELRKEMVQHLHPCSLGKVCTKCQSLKNALLQYFA